MNGRQGGKSLSPRGSFSTGRGRGRIEGGKKLAYSDFVRVLPVYFSFRSIAIPPPPPHLLFPGKNARESRNDDESLLKCF